MIQEYLDGVAGCATSPRTPAQVAALEAAISSGYIRWMGKREAWSRGAGLLRARRVALCRVLPSLCVDPLALAPHQP